MSSPSEPSEAVPGQVMTPPAPGVRACSIADALQVIGDRYALLVLRELSFGVTRFNDIRERTGAPRETLTARLRKLEDDGLIERRRYSEHPPRDEYVFTEAGDAIRPVLRELHAWGARYAPATRPGGFRG